MPYGVVKLLGLPQFTIIADILQTGCSGRISDDQASGCLLLRRLCKWSSFKRVG